MSATAIFPGEATRFRRDGSVLIVRPVDPPPELSRTGDVWWMDRGGVSYGFYADPLHQCPGLRKHSPLGREGERVRYPVAGPGVPLVRPMIPRPPATTAMPVAVHDSVEGVLATLECRRLDSLGFVEAILTGRSSPAGDAVRYSRRRAFLECWDMDHPDYPAAGNPWVWCGMLAAVAEGGAP